MALYKNAYKDTLLDDSDIAALEASRNPQPPAAEAAPPQAEAEEPLEGFETVQPTAPPADAEERTYQKRYADLRRHMAAKEREWKERMDSLESQLKTTTQQSMQLPTSEEEVKKWAEAYPDVARIVETIAITKAREEAGVYEQRLKDVERRERLAARKQAELELMKTHPDFDHLRRSPDFHDWVSKQPRLLQIALYENETDWQAAARAIDLYKADKARLEPKRGPGRPRKEETAADAPAKASRDEPSTGPQKRVFSESEIAKMSPRQFEALEEEIMEAKREGRIVGDMRNTYHRAAAAV